MSANDTARQPARKGADSQRRTWVLHPVFAALFPAIFFYGHNLAGFNPSIVVRPILVCLVVAAIITWVAGRIVGDLQRGALITSVGILTFVAHGYIYNTVEYFGIYLNANGWSWADGVFALTYGAFLLGCMFFISRLKSPDVLTRFMNAWTVILVAIPTIHIVSSTSRVDALDEQMSRKVPPLLAQMDDRTTQLPDIYFIVLDGYARSDVLKEFYDYDNDDFLGYLRERGFLVVDNSFSNYSVTAMSLAATLNVDYLDRFFDVTKTRNGNSRGIRELMRRNRLFDFLRRHGYSIVSFPTVAYNADIPTSDVYLSRWWHATSFEMALTDRTPIPWLFRKCGWAMVQDWHRAMILDTLDNLPRVPRLDGPKFVYAHILAPHPPFLFGPRGEALNPNHRYDMWLDGGDIGEKLGGGRQLYVDLYRGQVEFLGRRIKSIIGEILAGADTPPIIVLQSDHGPVYSPWIPERTDRAAGIRLGILNALYLPGMETARLSDTLTPVNTFRVILNEYFGAEYELLENRHYWAEPDRPYDWTPASPTVTPNPGDSAPEKPLKPRLRFQQAAS